MSYDQNLSHRYLLDMLITIISHKILKYFTGLGNLLTLMRLFISVSVIFQAMEKLVANGKCKAIGLSNFNKQQIERVMKVASVPVANLQVGFV